MIAALMHGHELIGRPVVDGSTGDDVAEIKDVVFDPGRGEITGFTLRKRGFLGRRLKAVLPVDQVVSVGTDAVMIDGIEALTSPGDAPDEMAPAPNGNVLSNQVVTESGRSLGAVKDVIVRGGRTPQVVGFEVERRIGRRRPRAGRPPFGGVGQRADRARRLRAADPHRPHRPRRRAGDHRRSTAMIHLSALIGQQAIALGTAATTGSVKGVAIDHDRIVGVQVGDELIASGAVRSFEGDVLTYDETAAGVQRHRVGLRSPRQAGARHGRRRARPPGRPGDRRRRADRHRAARQRRHDRRARACG